MSGEEMFEWWLNHLWLVIAEKNFGGVKKLIWKENTILGFIEHNLLIVSSSSTPSLLDCFGELVITFDMRTTGKLNYKLHLKFMWNILIFEAYWCCAISPVWCHCQVAFSLKVKIQLSNCTMSLTSFFDSAINAEYANFFIDARIKYFQQ